MTDDFNPDWIVSPGEILEEHLAARKMKKVTLANSCGVSPKHISQVIAGVAPVTAHMALKFEEALGMSAEIWLKLEATYRLRLLREKREKRK